MKFLKIENIGFIGIITAIVLAFFYLILGVSGMMAILGIMLLFIVPFYLILDNFDFSQDEKIVFSFFIGVGIFPAIAYWAGMVISFRIAIIVSFIVLIAAGFVVRKYLYSRTKIIIP